MTEQVTTVPGVTRSGGFGVAVLFASLLGAAVLSMEAANRLGAWTHGHAPDGNWLWGLLPLALASGAILSGVYLQRNLDRNRAAAGWLILGYCLASIGLGVFWLAAGVAAS